MFKFDAKSTALIVIDMQNAFLDSSSPYCVVGAESLLTRVSNLVIFCRSQNIPVIFTKVVLDDEMDGGPFSKNWFDHGFDEVGILKRGTRNVEIHSSLHPHGEDLIIEKPRYSAFYSTRLDNLLKARNVKTIIIAGADTKFCVLSTSRDAQFRDYQVLVLHDCIATGALPDLGWGEVSAEEVEKVILTTIAIGDGEVIASDEFIRRLGPIAPMNQT
ncbi:MAG: cysteine hydrolase family protein [Nitrososphaerales archaeon]